MTPSSGESSNEGRPTASSPAHDINVALQCPHASLNRSSVRIRPGVHLDDREDVGAAIVASALRLFV
ncbi:hypothetical protein [Streptomyces sp. NPDC048560]|uniref:hypothetical protein n=1 Tax=Streptomyces sp. NPDC048560 TaxID=3155488 RepID=UPI0034173A00